MVCHDKPTGSDETVEFCQSPLDASTVIPGAAVDVKTVHELRRKYVVVCISIHDSWPGPKECIIPFLDPLPEFKFLKLRHGKESEDEHLWTVTRNNIFSAPVDCMLLHLPSHACRAQRMSWNDTVRHKMHVQDVKVVWSRFGQLFAHCVSQNIPVVALTLHDMNSVSPLTDHPFSALVNDRIRIVQLEVVMVNGEHEVRVKVDAVSSVPLNCNLASASTVADSRSSAAWTNSKHCADTLFSIRTSLHQASTQSGESSLLSDPSPTHSSEPYGVEELVTRHDGSAKVQMMHKAPESPSPHRHGSLRDITRVLKSSPRAIAIGCLVRGVMVAFLDKHPGLHDEILRSVTELRPPRIEESVGDELRQCLMDCFKDNIDARAMADPSQYVAVDQYVSSRIDGELLHHWATAAEDPGADSALWLFKGAPAGVQVKF